MRGRPECSKTRIASRRSGWKWLLVALMVVATAGCGDERIVKHGAADDPDTAPTQPSDDASDPDREFQKWYDDQESIRVPWSHKLTEQIVADATIGEDRVSWPLPEYDYMTRWTRNEVLWAPIDDPTRSFLRRVTSMEVTDGEVIFETRNATFEDLFFKARIDVDASREQQLIPGMEESTDEEGLSTRQQDLYMEANGFEHLIGFGGSLKYGFCYDGNALKPCSSADISCPAGANDGNDACDDYDHQPGPGVEPASASPNWGVVMEMAPQFRVTVDRFYFVQDIDSNIFWDPDGQTCRCLARHYSEDVTTVAGRCNMDVDDVVNAKGDCVGENSFLNIELAGGASIEYRDMSLKAFEELTVDKKFQLFQSIPLPLGSTGITLQLTANLTPAFNAGVEGELHWRDAAHGPRFGFDFGFGIIAPEDDELGTFYEVEHGTDNTTAVPDPSFDLSGRLSASLKLEVGLLAKFAGMLGVSLDIGAKAEAGVEGSSSVDTGTGEVEDACRVFFDLGGTLGATALVDLGIWSTERNWSIFDTCADPQDNLFDLDMTRACYQWENQLCDDPTPSVSANHVRLTAVDPHVGGTPGFASLDQRDDPYGIEIDAIYVERDGERINPTSLLHGGSAAGLDSVDFGVCDHSSWDTAVGTFENLIDVEFEDALQPGDTLVIYRQGFPLNQGGTDEDGTTIYCHPSGSFDVEVGNFDGSWSGGAPVGTEVSPNSNVHEFELTEAAFPQ